jgi:hypothetical protein
MQPTPLSIQMEVCLIPQKQLEKQAPPPAKIESPASTSPKIPKGPRAQQNANAKSPKNAMAAKPAHMITTNIQAAPFISEASIG